MSLYEVPKQAPRIPCRACGRPIVFVHTDKGRRMPVNADGAHLGESHFAHCTDPKRFRKRERVAGAQQVLAALDAVGKDKP